jgi:hypothetical protein
MNNLSATSLTVGVALVIALTTPAYAYLDPGTGSMLLQGLIAVVAGGATLVTMYYQRVKDLISRMVSRARRDS